MAKRKPLRHDANRRAQIAAQVGSLRIDNWVRLPQDYAAFIRWQKRTHPHRDFAERVYAAMLITQNLELACRIAERSASIEEAGIEAKAVAALKEIAGG